MRDKSSKRQVACQDAVTDVSKRANSLAKRSFYFRGDSQFLPFYVAFVSQLMQEEFTVVFARLKTLACSLPFRFLYKIFSPGPVSAQ